MKKILSLVLSIIIIFAFCTTVSAENDYGNAYDAILQSLLNYDERIDISSYRLPASEFENGFESFIRNHTELFYVDRGCMYSQNGAGNVVYILFDYIYTPEEFAEISAYLSSEANRIISLMPKNLSDTEKALFLHDYICLNFEYDCIVDMAEGTYYVDTENCIYDYPTMLMTGRGVCEAYSSLYKFLLEKVGIESRIVTSLGIVHAWNEIKLGDSWYYVDVTWDDPIPDTTNRALHKYFLLSENAFLSDGKHLVKVSETSGYKDFTADHPCTDTRYDNLSWHSVNKGICIADGGAYVLADVSTGVFAINKLDIENGDVQTVKTVDSLWYGSSRKNSYYQVNFSALIPFKGKIIFNTYSGINCFDPLTGTVTETFVPDISGGIFEIYKKDGKLYYGVTDNGYTNLDYSSTGLAASAGIVYGDCDKNGAFDSDDLIYACQLYAGMITLSDVSLIDVDGSGAFDASDLIFMCQRNAELITVWPGEIE